MCNSESADQKLWFIKTKQMDWISTSLNTENGASQLECPVTLSDKTDFQTHVGGGKFKVPFMGGELASMKMAGLTHEPLNQKGSYKFIDYMVDHHAKTRGAKGK